MNKKLAASLELLAEAMSEVIRKRSAIIGAATLPIAGILLSDIITAEISSSSAAQFWLVLIQLPLYALFATVIHRIVLLGEDSLPNRWGLFWTERETRFLGWLVGLWFLYFALSLPLGLMMALWGAAVGDLDTAWLPTLLFYFFTAYFEGRFSLVLPATAIDRQLTFSDSWALSQGRGMMIAVALVIPMAFLIPFEWVLYRGIDDAFLPIADLVWLFVALPIYAIAVATISLAYDKLSP